MAVFYSSNELMEIYIFLGFFNGLQVSFLEYVINVLNLKGRPDLINWKLQSLCFVWFLLISKTFILKVSKHRNEVSWHFEVNVDVVCHYILIRLIHFSEKCFYKPCKWMLNYVLSKQLEILSVHWIYFHIWLRSEGSPLISDSHPQVPSYSLLIEHCGSSYIVNAYSFCSDFLCLLLWRC